MAQKCSKCDRDAVRRCGYCGEFCCSRHGYHDIREGDQSWFHRSCRNAVKNLRAAIDALNGPWYDDLGKISKKIVEEGLSGLNEVAHARHIAHYERGEMLMPYIIDGIWYTDSCGNWGKIQWPNGRPDLAWLTVMTPDDFTQFCAVMDLSTQWMASMSNELPPDEMVCDICHQPWTIKDCHLAVVTRRYEEIPLERFVGKSLREVEALLETELSATVFFQPDLMLKHPSYNSRATHPDYSDIRLRDGGWVVHADKDQYKVRAGEVGYLNIWAYRHPLCQEIRLTESYTDYFGEIFSEAGFQEYVLVAIPNEYCGDPTCCGPWFRVTTEVGNFKVGWRKRVILLQWAGRGVGPRRRMLQLFKQEDVTKGQNYIHAWGRDKLIDYLQRIRNHLIVQNSEK